MPRYRREQNCQSCPFYQQGRMVGSHLDVFEIIEWHEAQLKKLKDEAKEKDKKPDGPKPRTFTFLECIGISAIMGMIFFISWTQLLTKVNTP